MATTKSIRLNARAEKMFNVIKSCYDYRGGISDTEILLNGLEILFEQVTEDLNDYFKTTMERGIEMVEENPSALSLFYSICNILEVLGTSEGDTLQAQFHEFLLVNEGESQIYTVDNESKERYPRTPQYIKAWEKICESERKTSGIDEDRLVELLEFIGDVYKEHFPEK